MNNLGQRGEDFAVQKLKSWGWRIIKRNHAERSGELDIIAREPSGVLVVVEVKALNPEGGLIPEDHFTPGKLKRMAAAATMFVAKHPQLINRGGWRLDLLALTLTKDNKSFEVRHYPNVALFDTGAYPD